MFTIRRLVAAAALAAATVLPVHLASASGPGSHLPNPNANPNGQGAANPHAGGNSNATPSGGGDGGHGPATLPPQASPVAGERVDVAPASGTVLVQLAATQGFVPLGQGAGVPVGATIDATRGVVTLTSVGRDGKPQSGDFWGTVFRVEQSAGPHPVTVLRLVGAVPPCSASKAAVHSSRSRVRRLWGHDHGGSFRTRGRYGSATVRGTVWLTQERCDGTFFRVTSGAVTVRDTMRQRNVTVRAGQSYLARRA